MILCRIILVLYLIYASLCDDYYELLGIEKTANIKEIRKAFKKLALVYHPDKNKGKDDAHEKFLAINKAYEILKDEEMRKKYDLYGEAGLKDDAGKNWKDSYRSWNYYHESFGIYDEDPEIVTMGHSDFERLVLNSRDMWFVNFYSPQCSHCHILAPDWRKLARELQGVIQIGAVNCEEDWRLCKRQKVYSYPTLIFYTASEKKKYDGSRKADDMVEFVLQKFPYNVIELDSLSFKRLNLYKPLPWLVFSCQGHDCVSKKDMKKLGIIFEHFVHVAEIDSFDKKKLCEWWKKCDFRVTYFHNISTDHPYSGLIKFIIDDYEVPAIVKQVLNILPGLKEISSEELEIIRKKENKNYPWLIQFTRDVVSPAEEDVYLKRLPYLLPDISFGHFNCITNESACADLYIVKFPTFIIFREGGTYEFYHGRIAAYEISRFLYEAWFSQVETLNPENFPKLISTRKRWFIDFFAPWCPPCINFLSVFRKLSRSFETFARFGVHFGTVDCSVHLHLCRLHNINSYPSAILYKDSVGHKYRGLHSDYELYEFIEDVVDPIIVKLSPKSFEEIVVKKSPNDVWVIDFFAPWCGPCQELAPQWRKLARMLKHLSYVHVGEVDCQVYRSFCSSLGVNSYPTIRLFPSASTSPAKFISYDEWLRDASSLQVWVYRFLPSNVPVLSDIDFQEVLADSNPWVIDFFTPWCMHCQTFAPEFERITQILDGAVKTGKVNCDVFPKVCRLASVSVYPTVLFYKGKTGSKTQHPVGKEIQPHNFNAVIQFLENKLRTKFQISDDLTLMSDPFFEQSLINKVKDDMKKVFHDEL